MSESELPISCDFTSHMILDDFINEYDNDHEPIYIRKKVQSCSNLKHYTNIDTSNIDQLFLQYTAEPKKIVRLVYNPELNTKSIIAETPPHCIDIPFIDNDFSGSSGSSIEEWNAEEETFSSKRDKDKENINKSFSERFYSTPKTFSATFTKVINNLFENPEGRMTNSQKTTIVIFTGFEAYRTIISSFLTVFVPQSCGGYSCTILQNLLPKDDIETAAISVNMFMALYFCILFTIERVRETIVKKYLIADKTSATDKDYLVQMLSEMNPHERHQIIRLNRIYRISAQFLLLAFFVNAGISCIVIYKNYLNNTTATVFITNTFFMINRIHKALKITSSGEYNIYSAYRTDNLLYNRHRGAWLQKETSRMI
jgi:hypothetical protein